MYDDDDDHLGYLPARRWASLTKPNDILYTFSKLLRTSVLTRLSLFLLFLVLVVLGPRIHIFLPEQALVALALVTAIVDLTLSFGARWCLVVAILLPLLPYFKPKCGFKCNLVFCWFICRCVIVLIGEPRPYHSLPFKTNQNVSSLLGYWLLLGCWRAVCSFIFLL